MILSKIASARQDMRKMARIRPAIEYIEVNYDRPLSLVEIAKSANLSVSRLVHLFKEQIGITVIEYLTGARIERAKQLLSTTEKSCAKICFEVGYNYNAHFTRRFKKVTGMTPGQFRAARQKASE